MTEADNAHRTGVYKQRAESGVGHSELEILHDSTRAQVTLKPFYIPHKTGPDELAIKIETHKKAKPPNSWVTVSDKSISMREPTARRLLAALKKHLAVAKEDDGAYLVIPIESGVADIGDHDPEKVAAALGRVLEQGDVVRHLAGADLSIELLDALKGAIRLREMVHAMAQLRNLLDSGEAAESEYQKWCEAHSWAFGNAYVVNDEVRSISESDNLDLLLPTVISGFRDVVELKRPDMKVLLWDKSHSNYYFGQEVSKALGQCHRYLDVFHEAAAKGLRDHPEIVAYHPRATLVIGRSHDWTSDKLRALHGLNRRLSGLTVMTYDQLLAQGDRLVAILSEPVPEAETEPQMWEGADFDF